MSEWKLPLRLELEDGHKIRSFATRQGRLTKGQRAALDEFWPQFGLDVATTDITKLMPQAQERILEIGFGNGESLVHMAHANAQALFLGIEVHQPGVGALLQQVAQAQLSNIRLFYADARDVITQAIPDQSLNRVQIFFPDPWPKQRHHKRRIIQPSFINMLLPKLVKNGVIHCATDWQPYAQHMLAVLSNVPELINLSESGAAMQVRPSYRPDTKFERRGQGLGHDVWDFVFQKQS